jgi:protein involved in polysaccharide export with SLBB domain
MLGDDGLAQNQPTSATRRTPFSGKIRPGDRLQIEIVGGLPQSSTPPRTVEPDGNVVIGAAYGDLSRLQVGGMTLIEAGKHIEAKVREVLREPHVLVTYVGHDPEVIAEGEATAASTTTEPPIVLAPLDTIEIILPLIRPRVHKSVYNGKLVEVFTGEMPQLSGTYVIEPDGRIALPQGLGRLAIAGMTEAQASDAMRKHLGDEIFTRTALPTTQILKRGHAVFPEGKLPNAHYRIKPGDSLLIGASPEQLFNSEVDSMGNVGDKQKAAVAGLTLEEAQTAVRKAWTGQATFDKAPAEVPWHVTIGGWREEAAPGVIDRIEGGADTRSLRLENEVQELKQMIRHLQLSR